MVEAPEVAKRTKWLFSWETFCHEQLFAYQGYRIYIDTIVLLSRRVAALTC